MGLTESSRGDKKFPTWLILLLLALGAVMCAYAADGGAVIPIR